MTPRNPFDSSFFLRLQTRLHEDRLRLSSRGSRKLVSLDIQADLVYHRTAGASVDDEVWSSVDLRVDVYCSAVEAFENFWSSA